MADVINVTGVVAHGGVNEITYNIVTDAPAAGLCVGYDGIARVEVWVSSTNNRGAASKVGDAYVGAAGVQYSVRNLPRSATRYAWFRAITVATNAGPFFPASVSAGIAATTSSQVPPDASVGGDQVIDNSIPSAKIIDLEVSKLKAGVIDVEVEINAPILRTAKTGQRVVISKFDNFIRIFNTSGQNVAAFGENSLFGASNVLSIQRNSVSNNILVTNSGTGNVLAALGKMEIEQLGQNRQALHLINNHGGGNAYALVFNTGDGGDGYCGVPGSSGGYAFLAANGGYAPFTGVHPGLLRKEASAEPGDILIDVAVIERRGIDDTLTEVAASSAAMSRAVIGVLSQRMPFQRVALPYLGDLSRNRRRWLENIYDLVSINALGEGQINVCGRGGDLEPGDYICTSDLRGKGQRQNTTDGTADDVKRRCTVARVRERVTFNDRDQVRLVACIYECG